MSDTSIIPVILSGGTGSRLWPLSRTYHPKQFLPLADPVRSMVQVTAVRLQQAQLGAWSAHVLLQQQRRASTQRARDALSVRAAQQRRAYADALEARRLGLPGRR